MREIKFRGWERELQMMVYDTELGGWIFEYDGNPVRAVNQMINEEDYFYDLMQYTGLKDKNGVEIYEGDIILNLDYIPSPVQHIVTYHKGAFGIRDKEHGFIPLAIYERPSINIERLGNIHQHKHLLEVD